MHTLPFSLHTPDSSVLSRKQPATTHRPSSRTGRPHSQAVLTHRPSLISKKSLSAEKRAGGSVESITRSHYASFTWNSASSLGKKSRDHCRWCYSSGCSWPTPEPGEWFSRGAHLAFFSVLQGEWNSLLVAVNCSRFEKPQRNHTLCTSRVWRKTSRHPM